MSTSGRQLEQFAAQMLEAADAGGRVVEHARLFLGEREQFLERMHRHGRIDGQHIGAGGDDAHRDEILHRIERLLVEPGIDRVRDGNDQERVAVGRRLGGEVGADDTAGAAAVIDEDLLAQSLAELIGDDAADHVVAAAGRERDDHADRAARIVVRGRCRRGEQRQREHKREEKRADRNRAKSRHQWFSPILSAFLIPIRRSRHCDAMSCTSFALAVQAASRKPKSVPVET